MKKSKLLIPVLMIIFILVFIVWYFGRPASDSNPSDIQMNALENPRSIYDSAVDKLSESKNLSYRVIHSKDTYVGGEHFSERSQQFVRFENIGSPDALGCVEESLLIGDQQIDIAEVYHKGTLYLTIQNAQFQGAISDEAYSTRYLPAAILSADSYESVSGYLEADQPRITFADPVSAEPWLPLTNAIFLQSEGSAVIDSSGNLFSCTYTASYTLDGTYVRHTVTTEILSSNDPILLPQETDSYVTVDYLDGPRALETASGYLLCSGNIAAQYNSTMFCEAFGDTRSEEIRLFTANKDAWKGRIDTNITLTNTSQSVHSSLSKIEQYTNGNYSISTDGAPPSLDPNITQDIFKQWCTNTLLGTVILPEHIAQCNAEIAQDSVFITYTTTEAFAASIGQNACHTLYQDSELLNNLAESVTPSQAVAYLEISTITGIPVCSGIRFTGTYTIADIPYQLNVNATQTYDVLDQQAYLEIYE